MESQLQKKILDFLDDGGYLAINVISCSLAGTSDIIACSPQGRFVAIEVKTDKGVVSTLQKCFLNYVIEMGGIGFVARSLEDVEAYLLHGKRCKPFDIKIETF